MCSERRKKMCVLHELSVHDAVKRVCGVIVCVAGGVRGAWCRCVGYV